MEMILRNTADIMLISATLGAGIFCLILSRRLTRLSRIDNGLGGAIAVLSAQVDDMSKALAETKTGSEGSATRLEELNTEARTLLEELELMISACHDVGEAPPPATDTDTANADTNAEPNWNVFEDLMSDDDDADAAWQNEAAPEALPGAKPAIMFGSRRQTTGDRADATIPLFLKSKSLLAGLG